MRQILGGYKQIGALVIAAGILAAIFVPFQRAEAFTAELNLPDNDPNDVPQSAQGSTFVITIDIAPGELVSLSQIELILDNGTPDVKRAIFDAPGAFISGDSDITVGDLIVSIPSSTTPGYGYGSGTISYGTSFNAPNNYAFSASPGLLSGNYYSYSYAVPNANFVNGFLGPATIMIEGKLNTADMSLGVHTLDVLVHTGSGGNGIDQIVPPQLVFTVTEELPPTPTSAADLIRALIIKAEGMGANANMLKQAPALLEDGNPNNDVAACGKLGAFINNKEAQAGKSITHEQAEELIADAQAIRELLECGHGNSGVSSEDEENNDSDENSSATSSTTSENSDGNGNGKGKGNNGNGKSNGNNGNGNGNGNGHGKGKNK